MVRHCVAFGCNNWSDKPHCKHLSWHSLPLNNKKLLATWLVKIKRENTPISKNSFLCSEHFEKECFCKSFVCRKVSLKSETIPTIFSFSEQKTKRKAPKERRSIDDEVRQNITKHQESSASNNEGDILIEDANEIPLNNSNEMATDHDGDMDLRDLQQQLKDLQQEMKMKVEALESQLKEEREARQELEEILERNVFRLENIKSNNKLIRFYTRFDSYETLCMVLDFLGRDAAANLKYQNKDRSNSNSTRNSGCARALSVENKFFMVLCRYKVGLLEEDLCHRFSVSQGLVSHVISTWTKFMFYRFKELDIFPSKEIIDTHRPQCFNHKYKSTTLIIDATDIYIEKPSNLSAQQLTFSTYKNTNTLKALVGITPKGPISFVSSLYDGSILDREITQLSGLIDKVECGHAVMADRGFNIGADLAEKGVPVNLPPFMNASGQFYETEMIQTRRIATLRIHVERAIERIKNYHILDFVPISMCKNGIIDMVFFVCAMLTNFQTPLVNG